MTIVFVTGLSGVGKSYTLERLEEQGYKVVDTDYGYVTNNGNGDTEETVLDEEKITKLLNENGQTLLFIAGCYSNQSKFYKHFDYVVLLTAEQDVMIKRIDERTTNYYGKRPEEKEEVIDSFNHVLPLLKNSSDLIIDTTNMDVDVICERLKSLL
ncbi:AAA family ATPase [Lederbergia sp. NSJ-179]|uniref:AAA family ATPase n=1 Tax=Lederbergia sp. NSJ-179 TaxID=2931402 RepID=UPI001FD48D7B|nr:AAA family ATPase [Lederbergia sp. NSJ-179]MCJ7842224.1 AAA family ATPase [Lederbergia sp. NSJ-179]